MKNKFRQNIVIGVIAIVGTMGYNLSINQENENVRLITGNIEALAEEEGYVRFDGQVACSRGGDFACTPIECKELYEIIF